MYESCIETTDVEGRCYRDHLHRCAKGYQQSRSHIAPCVMKTTPVQNTALDAVLGVSYERTTHVDRMRCDEHKCSCPCENTENARPLNKPCCEEDV
ncbi:hypothetical protein J6590_047573 [Homalodisca vitripennis]|nr:hypothetical protein J6590_047573 [Homalodisca vitripennis]